MVPFVLQQLFFALMFFMLIHVPFTFLKSTLPILLMFIIFILSSIKFSETFELLKKKTVLWLGSEKNYARNMNSSTHRIISISTETKRIL